MPNDNTHTLLPCPFCGADPEGFGQALAKDGKSLTQSVRHPDNGCCLSILVFRIEDWNTRTPAEPKAGDWEKELKCCIDLVPALINAIFELDSDHAMIEIAAHAHEKAIRALSSAAPRIRVDGFDPIWEMQKHDAYAKADEWFGNPQPPAPRITGDSDKSDLPIANSVQLSEEMVERVAAELLESYGKWVPDYRHAIADMKESILALLRQQGAERKWISFGERLPDLGQPIFAKIRDSKSKSGYRVDSADFPKDMEPLPGMSIREWVGLCDWEAWTPRFVDTPPPFTPTQEGKP